MSYHKVKVTVVTLRLSKNGVSNETCGKKLGNSNLIDKITLT